MSAQRAKSYRERQIERYELDAWREMEAKRKRESRLKKMDKQREKQKQARNQIDILQDRIFQIKEKKLPNYTKSSNDLIFKNVKRIYKLITGDELKSNVQLALFRDSNRVIRKIQQMNVSPNTKASYISNLASLTKYLERFEEAYEAYSKKSIDID